MPGYQSFSLNAVEKAQSSSAAAYREFLRRPGFSMGMYLLPAGRNHRFLNITEDLAVLVTFAPPDNPEA
jgi:hypothetical protein